MSFQVSMERYSDDIKFRRLLNIEIPDECIVPENLKSDADLLDFLIMFAFSPSEYLQ